MKHEIATSTTAAIFVVTQFFLLAGTATAREKPVINDYIRNPGYIDIFWVHDHRGADGYVVRRDHAGFWTYTTDAKTHPDRNLTPDTEYKYKVCAVYGKDEECSEWLAIRTLKAASAASEYPKPPPLVVNSEAYHEPPTIRIWWKKTGKYDRVIVRWRHQTGGPQQMDIDTDAAEGTFDAYTPNPGKYEFILMGCTLNFVGAANCGGWSAPKWIDTATLGAAHVECKPGMLQGAPRFEVNGRAEYHFEANRPGYNVPGGGSCETSNAQVAHYFVHGVWNPTARPGGWDTSGGNTLETFTVTLYPDFSPERAPKRPDVWDPTAKIHFITRAQCDRDPWLNANAVCRRTGNNVPQDIRAQWPALLSEPFPHTRQSVPAAERGALLSRYHTVTGTLVETAKPPAGSKHLEPAPTSPVIQGQAQTPEISAAASAQASTARGAGDRTQQATVNPAPNVTLNPQPLPPKASQPAQRQATVNPAQDVMLNPQPLPPKAVLLPRTGTVLQPGPMQTTSGGTRAVDPQGQIQATASGAAIDGVVSTQNADLSGQLVCQGGTEPALGSAYRTSEDGAEIQMMYIAFAEQATQVDGRGLVPGKCGFIGQPPTGSGASVVYFKSPAADRESMRATLTRAANYWRFVVQKNESGYYDASEHAQWTPPKNVSQALTYTRIRVNPSPRGVEFRFDGPADSNPRLMVANGPLTVLPSGNRSSEGAPLHLKAVKTSSTNPSGVAEFLATSERHRDVQASDEWLRIVPGAQYHYFLGNSGSTTQQEGTFATPAEPGTAAAPASADGGIRTSLLQLDDSTRLIVNDKPVTAGEFKREVAALDRESQSSSVTARPKISRSTGPAPADVPQLQPARLPGNVGSKLKEDCETREPRVHIVRGRISSGQEFTVEGACLGTAAGGVELIGQFPGGTLIPAVHRWDPSMIVASMPSLQGVPDHPVALSVVRATDRKRSDAKQFNYVAPREIVEIPYANFSPTSNYVRKYHDWHRGDSRKAMQPRDRSIDFQVNKHPACALDRMEAVGRVGSVSSIDGSDPGNSPAKITVNFHWHCKYEFTERRLAKFGFENDIRSDTNCEVAFVVRAWASCPVGIGP